MDFELDEEQQALRDAVRGLLKGYDAEHRCSVMAEEPGFDEGMWKRLGEMGVLGLPFAEDDGGVGAGPVEIAAVAEEIGRVLAPEPFVESVVLAGGLVAAFGSAEQRTSLLGGLADGSEVLAFADLEPGSGWNVAGGGVTARGGRLWGVKEPVPAGGRADTLVVAVRCTEGPGPELYVVRGDSAERTSYPAYDGTRAARISFDGAEATPLGDGGPVDLAALDRVIAQAQVAYCHEALGAMDTALRLTTSYLTTRKQFGVTLNRFQNLTFRASDMYVALELTRSIVAWATMVLAEEPDRCVEAAARAKLQVSKASRLIGQEAIQLHGGIGVTAEYAVGHYTARLTAIDHLLGDGRAQIAKLTEDLTAHGVVEPL